MVKRKELEYQYTKNQNKITKGIFNVVRKTE